MTSKASGQQAVARQDRGRLVELLVAGRPTAPEVAVVHRRKIVMNQRIGMDQLDRRRHLQCAAGGHAEQARRRQHEERAQPLAGRQRRIAHRVVDPRLRPVDFRDQAQEQGVDKRHRVVERGPEAARFGPGLFSQDLRAPSRPSRRRSA